MTSKYPDFYYRFPTGEKVSIAHMSEFNKAQVLALNDSVRSQIFPSFPGDRSMKSYRYYVLNTANTALNDQDQLTNAAMGLAGEAGEVLDVLKKHLYQGHALDKEKLVKELGDVRWYMELLMHCIGTDITEVQDKNVAKLQARYPNGFTEVASTQRKPEDK